MTGTWLRIPKRWWLATALLFGGAIVIVRVGQVEPRFEGRDLRDWLDDPALSESEIRRAVQAIGTNAIPTLQRWLSKESTSLERALHWVDVRQPYFIFNHSPSADANQRAMRGFLLLGQQAAPAVPWLAAGAARRDANFMFYAMALTVSGPAGETALDRIDSRASLPERLLIVRALSSGGVHRSAGARNALLHRLADGDVAVRRQVIRGVLERQHDWPPEVMAAMRERALRESDESLRALIRLMVED